MASAAHDIGDCIRDGFHAAIPQPTEWQYIRNQVDTRRPMRSRTSYTRGTHRVVMQIVVTVRRTGVLRSNIWQMLRCMLRSFCSSPSVSGNYEPTCGAYAVQFI